MFFPREVSLSGEFAEMLNKPKENAGQIFLVCYIYSNMYVHSFSFFFFLSSITGKRMSCGVF